MDIGILIIAIARAGAIDAIARTYDQQCRLVFNVTGTPAISVPTGFTASGIPLAMQIAGRAFDDGRGVTGYPGLAFSPAASTPAIAQTSSLSEVSPLMPTAPSSVPPS